MKLVEINAFIPPIDEPEASDKPIDPNNEVQVRPCISAAEAKEFTPDQINDVVVQLLSQAILILTNEGEWQPVPEEENEQHEQPEQQDKQIG